jgi:hypothetical protein
MDILLFLDEQQFHGVEMLLQRPKTALVACFHEFMHESSGSVDARSGRQSIFPAIDFPPSIMVPQAV